MAIKLDRDTVGTYVVVHEIKDTIFIRFNNGN